MRGKAKQRKMQAKFGDAWFITRPRKLYRVYFHTGINMKVVEWTINPY